jgi:hypothetical protein
MGALSDSVRALRAQRQAARAPQEIVQEMVGYDPDFPKRPLASPLMYDERTGTYEWGIPQLAIDALKRVVLPGAVLQGYQPSMSDVTEFGAGVGTGGIASSTLTGGVPRGALGMFAGPRARTANLAALERAQELAARDVADIDILRETGWSRGRDGDWQYEISDDAARLYNPDASTLGGAYDHPELFEAYPDLRDVPFYRQSNTGGVKGQYTAPGARPEEIWLSDALTDAAESILAHEVQHGIQYREGWPTGGDMYAITSSPHLSEQFKDASARQRAASNELNFMKYEASKPTAAEADVEAALRKGPILDRALNRLNEDLDAMRYRGYQSVVGEAQARNTENRLRMLLRERNASLPADTETRTVFKSLEKVPLPREEQFTLRRGSWKGD